MAEPKERVAAAIARAQMDLVEALAELEKFPVFDSSGKSEREQGISKAGNKHVRGLIVELAWMWLRWQPRSSLSQWYERRFAFGKKRTRKIGIVALARKLLIALWRYVKEGKLPEGAETKDWQLLVNSTARRHAKAAQVAAAAASV